MESLSLMAELDERDALLSYSANASKVFLCSE